MQFALQRVSAGADADIAILLFEPVPNLGARTRGTQIAQMRIQPIAAGRSLASGEHLDLLTGDQFVG